MSSGSSFRSVRQNGARALAWARRGAHELELSARSAWHRADPIVDRLDPTRARCVPRDPDDLGGYRDRFAASASAFDHFLDHCPALPPDDGGAPVAVVVTPWYGTAAPWYAIALGIGLRLRGRPVTYIWHDTRFPEVLDPPTRELTEIRRVLARVGALSPVVRLGAQDRAEPRPGDAALVDTLTDANASWGLRGAEPAGRFAGYPARIRAHLAADLPRVRSVMRRGFRYGIVPGGVVGSSGLYLAVGREVGCRVATFDAGLGWAEINGDGVAAQQTDTGRAFAELEHEPPEVRARITVLAQDEFARRRSGSDATNYQLARPGAGAPDAAGSVLIPLSVNFDTAALGRHHIFPDSETWLVETIRSLRAHTSDPILVRQHPSERKPTERSQFDVERILADHFAGCAQVRLIAAADPVNTYELLDAARLVIAFVSTIGIEAAARGKPVIISGDVYYGPLGIVHAPSTRADYERLLERGARGELGLLPDQITRAWWCYYLNAVCHRVFTDFTPQPPDFWRWVRRDPTTLFEDPDVDDILRAADETVPLSILRHRRLMEATAPDEARNAG